MRKNIENYGYFSPLKFSTFYCQFCNFCQNASQMVIISPKNDVKWLELLCVLKQTFWSRKCPKKLNSHFLCSRNHSLKPHIFAFCPILVISYPEMPTWPHMFLWFFWLIIIQIVIKSNETCVVLVAFANIMLDKSDLEKNHLICRGHNGQGQRFLEKLFFYNFVSSYA